MRRRRYEVLLPLQFNDGRDVPPELHSALSLRPGGTTPRPLGIWIGDSPPASSGPIFRPVDKAHTLVPDASAAERGESTVIDFASPLICGRP